MNSGIKTLSKLFFVFGMTISVKGYSQQDLIAKNETVTTSITDAKREKKDAAFSIIPAVVTKTARILVNAEEDGWATLQIKAVCGEILLEQQMAVSKGVNKIPVFFVSDLEKGVYTTVLKVEENVYFSKLVKE